MDPYYRDSSARSPPDRSWSGRGDSRIKDERDADFYRVKRSPGAYLVFRFSVLSRFFVLTYSQMVIAVAADRAPLPLSIDTSLGVADATNMPVLATVKSVHAGLPPLLRISIAMSRVNRKLRSPLSL